jgi:ferredoxin
MTSGVMDDLDPVISALLDQGYTVVGPTVRDDAIVLAELDSADDLPWGWGVELKPGGYRLRRRVDRAAFGHSAGPQSWKPFLHRPRVNLTNPEPPPRLALLGVRPCDLRAIRIQDRVLTGGAHVNSSYAARREQVFIIAVNCTEPGETCFCASMGAGPCADSGYDLVLTELEDGFLTEAGSEAGARLLASVPAADAAEETVSRARALVEGAADRMGRSMPLVDLRDLMGSSLDSARWGDIASRCLSCGNCTMVCPTCFCTTTEDVTDLTGDNAERWMRWDSCFDLDFSYLHGGSVRSSAASRYRQWLTHKLGTWHDQFGESGCVGCGRCIVWCPVGIDLTEEVAALEEERRWTP